MNKIHWRELYGFVLIVLRAQRQETERPGAAGGVGEDAWLLSHVLLPSEATGARRAAVSHSLKRQLVENSTHHDGFPGEQDEVGLGILHLYSEEIVNLMTSLIWGM